MNRLFVFLLLFSLMTVVCQAQNKVAILGSLHTPSKYITQDTLLNAISRFKPDVILMELDTSLMDSQGNFKFDISKSLEAGTVKKYLADHAGVIVKAIDVANRNSYYKEHHTFAKEAEFGKAIDSIYKHNMLNDTSWFIVNSLYSSTQILNNLSYMKLKDINSGQSREAASFRQYLLYDRELEVIKNNPYLRRFYNAAKESADFWDLRNQTMIRNIEKYADEFPGKNILFIVGFYHKYAVFNELSKHTISHKFTLIDNFY